MNRDVVGICLAPAIEHDSVHKMYRVAWLEQDELRISYEHDVARVLARVKQHAAPWDAERFASFDETMEKGNDTCDHSGSIRVTRLCIEDHFAAAD